MPLPMKQHTKIRWCMYQKFLVTKRMPQLVGGFGSVLKHTIKVLTNWEAVYEISTVKEWPLFSSLTVSKHNRK